MLKRMCVPAGLALLASMVVLPAKAAYPLPAAPAAVQDANKAERLEWFRDQGLGLFIHWSVDSQLGVIISHSLAGASDEYVDRFYKDLPQTFDPTKFDPDGLAQTRLWGAQAFLCAAVWVWIRRRRDSELGERCRVYADALMPVLLAAMASGIAGMNMQVVTGFNLQQVQHYPHMILQPVGFMMMGVLVALVCPRGRVWRLAAAGGFVLALGISAVAQVEAGRDTAEMHRLPSAERSLFAWLNANTPVGSVVATDDLALSIVLPVQTHNSVLFADGSRSSAIDDELMERFLLAGRLVGTPPQVVAQKLAGEAPAGEDVQAADYPLYLFEFSKKYQRIPAERHVAPDRIAGLLQWYTALDVPKELGRFRVDYVWTQGSSLPSPAAGWKFAQVMQTDEGRLWQPGRE